MAASRNELIICWENWRKKTWVAWCPWDNISCEPIDALHSFSARCQRSQCFAWSTRIRNETRFSCFQKIRRARKKMKRNENRRTRAQYICIECSVDLLIFSFLFFPSHLFAMLSCAPVTFNIHNSTVIYASIVSISDDSRTINTIAMIKVPLRLIDTI